jgi:hypothetical protein
MTSSIKRCLFLTAVCLLSLRVGYAQSLADTATFSFGPPLTSVWDITGTYQITNHMQGAKVMPMDIVFRELNLDVTSRGRVEGSGTIVVMVGNDPVAADYKVSGSMSGGGTKTRANFSIRCKGQGIVANMFTAYTISANYNLVVDSTNLTMVGKTTGSAHFSHLGSGSLNSDTSLPLPVGADGNWDVTLSILPFVKVAGTGLIYVDKAPGAEDNDASPRLLATKLTGSVSKSGVAKLKLSGYGNSGGSQLNLTLTSLAGSTNQLTSVKGKILGQTVND